MKSQLVIIDMKTQNTQTRERFPTITMIQMSRFKKNEKNTHNAFNFEVICIY